MSAVQLWPRAAQSRETAVLRAVLAREQSDMKERQQHENKMKKKTRNITLDGELFYWSAAVLSA